MENLKKSTIIETVASTMDTDSQGEILDINGADISALQSGFGFCNSDHRPGFANLVGHVLEAKKIMKAEDAETSFQSKEWSRLRRPFLAIKAEIWDGGHGHIEAESIGAIYKHFQSKGQQSPIKVSVEGKVNRRGSGKEGHILKETTIRGIAITVAPANKSTSTEVVQITKSMGFDANSLMKSESPKSFIEITEDKSNYLSQVVKLQQLLITANKMMQTGIRIKK